MFCAAFVATNSQGIHDSLCVNMGVRSVSVCLVVVVVVVVDVVIDVVLVVLVQLDP